MSKNRQEGPFGSESESAEMGLQESVAEVEESGDASPDNGRTTPGDRVVQGDSEMVASGGHSALTPTFITLGFLGALALAGVVYLCTLEIVGLGGWAKGWLLLFILSSALLLGPGALIGILKGVLDICKMCFVDDRFSPFWRKSIGVAIPFMLIAGFGLGIMVPLSSWLRHRYEDTRAHLHDLMRNVPSVYSVESGTVLENDNQLMRCEIGIRESVLGYCHAWSDFKLVTDVYVFSDSRPRDNLGLGNNVLTLWFEACNPIYKVHFEIKSPDSYTCDAESPVVYEKSDQVEVLYCSRYLIMSDYALWNEGGEKGEAAEREMSRFCDSYLTGVKSEFAL